MGNGGSKGGGGGGSGSKGNSICGIDRRDIRSITHEYTSDKSKTGTICITSSISKGGVTDCFSTHYRESYPSASSDSRGGEGRVVGNSSSVSNISATSIYGEPINKNTLSITEQRAIKTDFTKILRDLYPQDYSKHIDNWPSTLWGKQVLERGDFEAIEKFFITEFVDTLHKRYPNDYPADFKDWNSKNSQWGKEVILTKNFKAIGKWLPAYKKEVLEQQTVLKNDFIEILHRVYPEDYPMNFKDWNNIWGKEVLERGDLQAIEKHLPSYEKQALEKEQNILFLVKDKSDVYLGGMSIGDYGVKLIIGNIANKITTLNLANNQIRDDGAKLLADSLAKGEMPNLKTLRLEGNKITDEGETALVKAMKGKAQDIIILTQRVDITKKMISGTKEEKIAIYKDLIEKGKAKGTYDEALVIDKSLWGEIKNSGKILKVVTNASIGFTKCHFAPEDIAVDYAQNKIMAKLPKMINGVLNYAAKLVDLENIFTCYVDASEDAWTSAVGQQAVKHELCVVGETEFCGE